MAAMDGSKEVSSELIFDEGDLPFEEDVLRNSYSIKRWLRYLEHKFQTKSSPERIILLYERALQELPGSYKLWYRYLKYRVRLVRFKPIRDASYEEVNRCFERALVFMHKMPRIWIDYCEFLTRQMYVTRTRKTFDRALRALPLTQSDRVWPSYLKFVKLHSIPETAIRVYRRYLKLCPENAEEFIEFLESIDKLDEAAVRLAELVNDEKFVSKRGKSNHMLWHELCELISKNPKKVTSLKVEPIIRQGIKRYTDQVGSLWCSLADYFIRSGLFEKSRDIYEEAIQTVTTVRDFTQVYDAYAQFAEQIVNARMEALSNQNEDELDIDLLIARFEYVIERRPLLLNSVILRQNPHNVAEWHKRVQLYDSQPHMAIETFLESVRTVDPKQQNNGRLYSLWVAFAKYYEKNGQLDDGRSIFEKGLVVPYVKVDDLAAVWCEYAEMELRHDNYKGAIHIMRRATANPFQKTHYFDESEPAANRVYKSLKVWSMYADLEESFGTFESCKIVYDHIIDLKIATPQIVINYGMFLEEQNHFEDAFKAYEKGIALFKWPHVFDIWNTYLTKFISRYGGKKLERARDLFEQCLETCPKEFSKNIYLLYAKLEEEHGLARHAMSIYSRATEAVPKDDVYDVFNIYINKAAEIYGVTHTRPIYERAIEVLPEEKSRQMCIRFAELERKLGEIDRARAIYAHCSQMCDPRVHEKFWDIWKDFEVKHGNEDTVREMLRIRRSVQATFNTQVNYMSAQMLASMGGQGKAAADFTAADSMAMLEAKAQQLAAEKAAMGTRKEPPAPKGSNIAFVSAGTTQPLADEKEIANPDEIELDEDEEEEEEEGGGGEPRRDVVLEKQAVPSEVFGSLARDEDDE